jgi:hypothetical protein
MPAADLPHSAAAAFQGVRDHYSSPRTPPIFKEEEKSLFQTN